MRVKKGAKARRRRNRILKLAKGFRGRRSKVFRVANEAVMKAGQYAYRDRRQRKRQFRQLWITRINAAARELGMTYSQFMNGLHKASIDIDRKALSETRKKIKELVTLIEDGGGSRAMVARLRELEAREDELTERLGQVPADVPDILPNVAGIYRRKVERLSDALQRPQERDEAADECARQLLGSEPLAVVLAGRLAGFLDFRTRDGDNVTRWRRSACVSGAMNWSWARSRSAAATSTTPSPTSSAT